MSISNGAKDPLIGHTLGNRYLIERVLGKGGMGTVYYARQIELGTPVSVKVLHPRLATDPGLVLRFEREAFASSRLDHPNALRVLDFGEDGDLFYLVTEYAEAEDLLAIMEAHWPLSDERVVSILSQVLSALVAVHEVGIVHRDLKPENILVLSGQNDDGAKVDVVKVCDFGIAKVARPAPSRTRRFSPRLTAEGVVVGTPDYMSPEQARCHAVDGRSDLYSVGVVLYQLLAGRTPFDADTPVGIAMQHVSDAPVPPSHYRQVHPGLEAVCLRVLSKRPEDRFQTAQEMRKAMCDALTAGPTATALVPAWVTALRAGSNFSTSSPAMLSLRPLRRMHGPSRFRDKERQRKRLSIGYAAVASVATITASALVARRGSRNDTSSADDVHAVTTLVSPPLLAAAAPLAPEATSEPEPREEVTPSTPAMSLVGVAPRRAAHGRPPPATKSQPRKVVVAVTPPALPISPRPPASPSPLLVRIEPWPRRAEAPPTRSEPRDPSQQAPSALPRQASAASPSFDASRASVAVSNIATSAGISGAKVRVTLAHVPLSACYKQALRSHASEVAFETELRLVIDVGGRIVSAVLSRDGNLPGLRNCIESVVRGAQIRDVGAGDGSATAQVRFSPR